MTISVRKDSNASSIEVTPISPQEKQLHSFVKQMLVGRLFIGTFQEKRYVHSIKSYRDVIVISKDETELIKDIEGVRKRIQDFYSINHWIGMTTPDMVGAPVGYCLWVELADEVFGSYWYKIGRIKFRTNETLLRLKIIRPVSNVGGNVSLSCKKSTVHTSLQTQASVDNNFRSSELQDNLNTSLAAVGQQFQRIMTVHNTAEAIKFVFLLLMALCTGLLKIVEFLGDFAIKLLHEASFLIQAMTPIIIACINLIGKIIGGFYLLILGMWRDSKGPPVYNSPSAKYFAIDKSPYDRYNTTYNRRGLPSPTRRSGGPIITPLD